jgi:hypothetical protein
MWQGFYYDTSTNGDRHIGWHVNAPGLNGTPLFFRAEKFRKIYERPDVLTRLLEVKNVQVALGEVTDNPWPAPVSGFEQPVASINLAAATTKDDDVKAKLSFPLPGDNPDFQPVRAELWINDWRLFVDFVPLSWQTAGGRQEKVVTIPNTNLRVGQNVVTLQVFNRVGGRAELSTSLQCTRAAPPPRLFGLSVGVNDYSAVKTNNGRLSNLRSACNDATEIHKIWQGQKILYKDTNVVLLLDGKAQRAEIIARLDRLATKVGPEDRCIIFLSGHGLLAQQKVAKGERPRSTFVFCGPDFDLTKPEETGLSSEVLYEKLAAIAGRKLVILDAAHSGEVAINAVRGLVPGGQGPIILASCDRNQVDYEFPINEKEKRPNSLFTYALLEALGDKFAEADTNGDKELDAHELYWYTRRRMPELLNQKEDKQVPILFAPSNDFFAVARAKQ